jgi:hypothetical protein
MAIFVEDAFAKDWVESILRNEVPERMDEIGVYAVSGDAQAYSIHLSHRKNPSLTDRLGSVCILDGNSTKAEDLDNGIIKLPGDMPEAEVFNYVRNDIENLSMKLAVSLHLSPEKETYVKKIVEDISLSNRDPHLLFNQVGQKAGLIPANIVSSAFLGLWISGNKKKASQIAEFIVENLDAT